MKNKKIYIRGEIRFMENNSKLGIASITLGIISIVFFAFLYVSVPTGILAIIYGKKTRNSKSGIVTGIVGISVCTIFYATMITLFAAGVFKLL